MPEAQAELLREHQKKDVNIQTALDRGVIKSISQAGSIEILTPHQLQMRSIPLELPGAIKLPGLIETEHYYYVYNLNLSPAENNVVKYSKSGERLNVFGRKGKGPEEFLSLDSIQERNHITYIFDNGFIKLLDSLDTEIDRRFLGFWAKDSFVHKETIDLRISSNEVFSFPVVSIDKNDYALNFSVDDARKDNFNYLSSNNTTFFSNDSLIIYAKTTDQLLHFIPKDNPSHITTYQIESEIIRENEHELERSMIRDKDKIVEFFNTLFLMEKLFLSDNHLWITFMDRSKENIQYYLGKIPFPPNGNDSSLSMMVYDLSVFNTTISFFSDHLYYSTYDDQEDSIDNFKIHQVPLSSL